MEVVKLGTQESETFRQEVEQRSGEKIGNCYQCHKCTAGCPAAFAMDLGPGRIMRLVQMGQAEAVLGSDSIWLCASCMTCTTRCPQEIDIARIMDALRIMSKERGLVAEKNVSTFNSVFLASVRRHGRVFEPMMIAMYNLKSLNFFKDMTKGPGMFFKGKLPMFPHNVEDKQTVQRIFEESEGGRK